MSSESTVSTRASVWKHGIVATLAAAVVTTALAALAMRAGVEFVDPAYPDKPIPPLGFATLTVAFSLIGVGLAAIFARTARHPRAPGGRSAAVRERPLELQLSRLLVPVSDGLGHAGLHVSPAL